MNVGGLSFTYGLETDDTVGSGYVFNAHDASWITFIRGLFNACQTMYRNRESAGCFNSKNFLAKVKAWQDTRPERVWVADAQRKYLRPYEANGTITYIPMLAGRKIHQREQTKTYNEYYYASKYVSDLCTSQNIMVRGNTPTTWNGVAPANTATLSMYINCYIVVASTSYNVVAKTKATRGQSYVMDFSTIGSMGETELYFCTAPMITELSGLAHLYFKQNNFSMGTNLQRLEVGSNVEGYENPNLESLTIGNNRMLEYLDVRNCPNATGALDLSGCISLSEVYLDNTAFTGITFAKGGLLRVAHLPSPTSLTMMDLMYVSDLKLGSANNLTTIRIEDCDFDDATTLTINTTVTTQSSKDIVLNLVESSPSLTRARLIGIDWLLSGTNTLNRLLNMSGISDDGFDISQSVLTGYTYVNGAIRLRELSNYASTWQYLSVEYNPEYLVEQYIATYVNEDGTELCQIYVDRGSQPPDPVATGVIQAPTKESDDQYDYTFSGWNEIVTAMTVPRTIVALYSTSVRTYTVTWYSRAGVPLKTTNAAYGSEVVYGEGIPTRVDGEESFIYYVFTGWDKSTGYITGDTNVYAVWDVKSIDTSGTAHMNLNTMSVAEIYGLGQAANRAVGAIDLTRYLDSKDYVDIQVGNDFNFSNVESEVLCENQWFDGTNYIDTNVKLLDADSPSFTLAVDYEFYRTENTLMSCFKAVDTESYGIRLRYQTNPSVVIQGNVTQVGNDTNRGICVIRHQAGTDVYHIYTFNTNSTSYNDNIGYNEVTLTRDNTIDSTLVFGAIKSLYPSGNYVYEDHGTGWIHWCKIWYEDLGDANARELAAWPHETWRAEYYGEFEDTLITRYRNYDTGAVVRLPFILNNLLPLDHDINPTSTNVGGYPQMTIRTFMNNRIYNALPTGWRAILKKARVSSSAGNRSSEIVYSGDYVFLPSYQEVQDIHTEPYLSEGSHIEWLNNTLDRAKFRNQIVPNNSTYYDSENDPTISSQNTVKQGDIWFTQGSYYYYIPQSIASKHVYKAFGGSFGQNSNITANNGGLWIPCADYWTRSPEVSSTQAFVRVTSYGGYIYPATANNAGGLLLCFAV